MFKTDYPELRAYLASQENFEFYMKKNAYICDIKDNEAVTAVQMLDFNNKVTPSTIVIMMPDGSYKEWWLEIYENPQNVPYDIRLPTYSKFYLIY